MTRLVAVMVEHDGSATDGASRSLGVRGRLLADKLGAKLVSLATGFQIDKVTQDICNTGLFDVACAADHESLREYNPELYVRALSAALKQIGPALVLLADGFRAREIGPAIASRLGAPFLGPCIDLDISGGKALAVQPKYGGTMCAGTEIDFGPNPLLASMQTGPYEAPPHIQRATLRERVAVSWDTGNLRTTVIGTTRDASGGIDIAKADIVVSGGRGLGKQENVRLIGELAEALGGVVACSRPLCDLGWLPAQHLVGLSGKTVAPKVYVACGISGAPQHIIAISGAKRIVAVNKDPGAPIMQVADYYVVGDVMEVLPRLIEAARERSSTKLHEKT